AALEWVPRVEAVAEHPGRSVRDERVLAQPALAVARVVRVEEEHTAVAVRRRADPRGAEAADSFAHVRVLAEDLLETAAVDPVGVDVELREVARPVGEVQPPGLLRLHPRREAEVRQRGLPALERPVRAVRRLAAGHEPRELGTVVGAARVLEGLPRLAVMQPAARVVELERDLLDLRGSRPLARIHSAPREQVSELALRPV